MSGLVRFEGAALSSQDIAELVGSRHDSVKRAIERLVERSVIAQPPMVETEEINNLGLARKVGSFVFAGDQGKRDSIVVVAQLSPEFTARLVDRWQELEAKAGQIDVMAALNDPAAMRGMLLTYTEKVLALEERVAEQAPKVRFHDQVAAAPDAISMAEAAKLLGTGRTRLMAMLRQMHWLTRYNEPYQDKIEAGLLDVKIGKLWEHPEQGLKRSITAIVTGKGLAKLQALRVGQAMKAVA